MYKLQEPDWRGNVELGVLRITDGAWIPFDPANRDYQEYLKWLDGYEYMMTEPMQMEWVKTSLNGNQPLPADE